MAGSLVTSANPIHNKAISWDSNQNSNEQFRKLFKAEKGYSWKLVSTETDKLGNLHTKYRQLFGGIEVDKGTIILHQVNSNYFITGVFIRIKNSNTINIDPAQQQKIVQNHLPAKATLTDQANAIELKLVADTNSGMHKLICLLNYFPENSLHVTSVSIDYNSGNKIAAVQNSCYADCTGQAETMYSGTKNISTFADSGKYYLKSTVKGSGIFTKNLNHQLGYQQITQYTDTDNYWEQIAGSENNYANDAHFCAEKYYDFLDTKFGRNSLDNAGFALISYLNYGTGFTNAFWNGQAVVYGSGNGNVTPFTTPDISGHEFTHGLIQKTAGLQYSGEPGIVNEAISDMLGVALEFYFDSLQANWLIGEQTGSALRSLENPNDYNQPASYHGNNWYYGTGDQGGVHINSGFLNRWFYLITAGGLGISESGISYNITGVGIEKSTEIIYHMLTSYLLPNSGFNDFKIYSLQSAMDLYGSCSPEYIAVKNAWDGVSFGNTTSSPGILITDSTFCQGDSVLLETEFIPGTIYEWILNGTIFYSGSLSAIYATETGSWSVKRITCSAVSVSDILQLNTFPVVAVSAGMVETCAGTPINLIGFPSGGNFNISNPYTGNSNTNYIYTFMDDNGCTLTASGYVQVNAPQTVNILTQSQAVPVNDAIIILDATYPATFNGIGVNGNTFNPVEAGIGGPYTISAIHVDENGCTSSDAIEIEVLTACESDKEQVEIITSEIFTANGTILNLHAVAEADVFSYEWKFPSGCIVLGENNQEHISVLWKGEESAVMLYLINTCKDTLIKEIKLEKIISQSIILANIYPNPTNGIINLQFNSDSPTASEVIISDAKGKKLESFKTFEKTATYNLNNFPKGIYFVQIKNANKVMNERVVLN